MHQNRFHPFSALIWRLDPRPCHMKHVQGQKQADWRKKREEFINTLRAAKEVCSSNTHSTSSLPSFNNDQDNYIYDEQAQHNVKVCCNLTHDIYLDIWIYGYNIYGFNLLLEAGVDTYLKQKVMWQPVIYDINDLYDTIYDYDDQAQRYVKAGGNLKDLPPPPPMDTSDYIQCPHCQRR